METSRDQELRKGVAAHQAGDLTAAAACYVRVLESAPGHADAQHLLGLVYAQTGQGRRGAELIRAAIAADATVPLYHANLGRVLKGDGDYQGAVDAYLAAIALSPEDAVLWSDLASARLSNGNVEGALKAAKHALSLDAGMAAAHVNLGLARQDLDGASDTAAMAALARAAFLDPGQAGAHLGLALGYHAAGMVAQARDAYMRALAIDPSLVVAHCNLGNLARDASDFEAASTHYRRALALDDQQPTVHGNLGVALQESGNLSGALGSYEKAIALAPDDPEIRRNRGMALLAAGRYAEGWADYEYRWQTSRFQALGRSFSVPIWDGRVVPGLKLWVHAEQGFGDTLQFCRYVPLLKAQGIHVSFECADPLRDLMQSAGADTVIAPGEEPDVDAHVPMMSLPGLFGTAVETIPASVPYLSAPADRMQAWQETMAAWPDGRRIGIAWKGAASHQRDALRSPGLAPFLALLDVPDVVLVSLQKEDGAADIQNTPGADAILDPTADINDFADTAAIMQGLDAVISCDSAPLHLAGSMGMPTYAVLPHVAEWRWGAGGDQTPWYPTMTLIRQPAPGDWVGCFEKLREIL